MKTPKEVDNRSSSSIPWPSFFRFKNRSPFSRANVLSLLSSVLVLSCVRRAHVKSMNPVMYRYHQVQNTPTMVNAFADSQRYHGVQLPWGTRCYLYNIFLHHRWCRPNCSAGGGRILYLPFSEAAGTALVLCHTPYWRDFHDLSPATADAMVPSGENFNGHMDMSLLRYSIEFDS